jgi:hypothetical protein
MLQFNTYLQVGLSGDVLRLEWLWDKGAFLMPIEAGSAASLQIPDSQMESFFFFFFESIFVLLRVYSM